MHDFDLIAPNTYKCKACQAEIPSGIINISGHWASCSGKEFTESINAAREAKQEPLTLKDIDQLRQ